jgi:hypothetical protein
MISTYGTRTRARFVEARHRACRVAELDRDLTAPEQHERLQVRVAAEGIGERNLMAFPSEFGIALPGVYAAWLVVIVLLHFLVRGAQKIPPRLVAELSLNTFQAIRTSGFWCPLEDNNNDHAPPRAPAARPDRSGLRRGSGSDAHRTDRRFLP